MPTDLFLTLVGSFSHRGWGRVPLFNGFFQHEESTWGWWPVFLLIKYSWLPMKLASPPLLSLLLHLRSWPKLLGRRLKEQVAPFWAASWTRYWHSAAQQLMRRARFLPESAHHHISASGLHRALIHLVKKLGKEPLQMITKGNDLIVCLTGQQTAGLWMPHGLPFPENSWEVKESVGLYF